MMTRPKAIREIVIMMVTLLAIYHASKSIAGSLGRQFFLNRQAVALRSGQTQAQEVNKELREGLTNYRCPVGIERLARERLNLAGSNEIIVRIGK
ncbi:MAG: septum formation initiator family protein, partial [Candidatus Melainabacteria bacterium]|nr:septum formation initiator family protein [Candidatus Melainabacteria bacterium]